MSEEGKGTTVDLYLPLAEPPEVFVTHGKARVETVLLVEDVPVVLRLATELFRSIGCETVEASSASEAAAILQVCTDIDVVFTDIAMPHGMSGMELARLVRSRYPAIKVVLTSGYRLQRCVGSTMRSASSPSCTSRTALPIWHGH